jgi:hypothetical protein
MNIVLYYVLYIFRVFSAAMCAGAGAGAGAGAVACGSETLGFKTASDHGMDLGHERLRNSTSNTYYIGFLHFGQFVVGGVIIMVMKKRNITYCAKL